ncbi:hypothetical protein MG293_000920 [Ovis ammon polii]|uniref:Uncharacterized protein n=1 Tax=Ovis ammon polii TaxID=230172 RepID=A0AAD4YF26_OVIAM|nr:hypothetical protein MG293_000920 [Ovis ammon polii]
MNCSTPGLPVHHQLLEFTQTHIHRVMDKPTRILCPWDFPGKNITVGCNFLLNGIFLTQGTNPRILRVSYIGRFIEIQSVYNKLHILSVYNLMSWMYAYTRETITKIKDLPHPGIEPSSPAFPADALPFEPPRFIVCVIIFHNAVACQCQQMGVFWHAFLNFLCSEHKECESHDSESVVVEFEEKDEVWEDGATTRHQRRASLNDYMEKKLLLTPFDCDVSK